MSENDPLAALTKLDESNLWVGRAWFTPKHEIRVVFDQWEKEPNDLLEQWEKARELYDIMRRSEWEFRLRAAQELVEGDHWNGQTPPEPEALARRMLLVEVMLFGDRSGHLTYHSEAPFEEIDIEAGVGCDGTVDGVMLWGREE